MRGQPTKTVGSRWHRAQKEHRWRAMAWLVATGASMIVAGCGTLSSPTPAYTSSEVFIEELNSTERARRLGVARAVRIEAGELRVYVTRRWYDHPMPTKRRLVEDWFRLWHSLGGRSLSVIDQESGARVATSHYGLLPGVKVFR